MSLTTNRGSLGVGLAGLTLFGLGLVTCLLPLLVLPRPGNSWSFGLLGNDFPLSAAVAVAVWPLGAMSLIGGFAVMLGRNQRLGLLCGVIWMALGLMTWLAGAAPGLLVAGTLVSVVLWRAQRNHREARDG